MLSKEIKTKILGKTCIEFSEIKAKNILIYFVANSKYNLSPSPNKDIICLGKT